MLVGIDKLTMDLFTCAPNTIPSTANSWGQCGQYDKNQKKKRSNKLLRDVKHHTQMLWAKSSNQIGCVRVWTNPGGCFIIKKNLSKQSRLQIRNWHWDIRFVFCILIHSIGVSLHFFPKRKEKQRAVCIWILSVYFHKMRGEKVRDVQNFC